VSSRDEPKIAVALKYAKEVDNAPKVVAKGVLTRAEKILEIAKKNNVPVMRNVPLAHALNRLEIGDEIPEELYDAVAEVLNYVFQMAREGAGR
jgi:flagellar biosynthesis protein